MALYCYTYRSTLVKTRDVTYFNSYSLLSSFVQEAPDLEFGNVYTGKVVELQKNGAFVQIHQAISPVFVKNSQLDLKVVSCFKSAPSSIQLTWSLSPPLFFS